MPRCDQGSAGRYADPRRLPWAPGDRPGDGRRGRERQGHRSRQGLECESAWRRVVRRRARGVRCRALSFAGRAPERITERAQGRCRNRRRRGDGGKPRDASGLRRSIPSGVNRLAAWQGHARQLPQARQAEETFMSDAVRSAVKDLTSGGRPDGEAMQAAFEAIFRGESGPALTAAFLPSLAMRGESASDIAAGAAVMRAHVRRVAAPEGAIDTCGTGGLAWVSLNTSTAAAFVAAGAGAVVAKHGNRSVPPKTGSADVLEALGVNLTPTDQQIEASFAKAGLAFMFAPAHHAAMKHVGP